MILVSSGMEFTWKHIEHVLVKSMSSLGSQKQECHNILLCPFTIQKGQFKQK
jgi:hypothetical protein